MIVDLLWYLIVPTFAGVAFFVLAVYLVDWFIEFVRWAFGE